jgi:hypothetical protein
VAAKAVGGDSWWWAQRCPKHFERCIRDRAIHFKLIVHLVGCFIEYLKMHGTTNPKFWWACLESQQIFVLKLFKCGVCWESMDLKQIKRTHTTNLTLSWPTGHIFPTYKESFQVRWDNSISLFLHAASTLKYLYSVVQCVQCCKAALHTCILSLYQSTRNHLLKEPTLYIYHCERCLPPKSIIFARIYL